MATDITTLAIALQSKEAESNLKVFNELLESGSDKAKRMERMTIGVDVDAAIRQLNTLRASYEEIAKTAQNIHFDMGINPEMFSPKSTPSVDVSALEELKSFFQQQAEAVRQQAELVSNAMEKMGTGAETASASFRTTGESMRGAGVAAGEYAEKVRELATAKKELEKLTAKADADGQAAYEADQRARAAKHDLLVVERELQKVSEQLSKTHTGGAGDIMALASKEDALKQEVNSLTEAYKKAQAEADKFNAKLDVSAGKADEARAKYNQLNNELAGIQKPTGKAGAAVDEFSKGAKQAGTTVTKLARGFNAVAFAGGAAIPGLSKLGMAISMFAYSGPYVGAAVVGIGLLATAIKKVREQSAREEQYIRESAERALKSAQKAREFVSESEESWKRLGELSEIGSLSNTQNEEATAIIQRLTEVYGDLGLEIDKTTGKLIGYNEARAKANKEDRELSEGRLEYSAKEAQKVLDKAVEKFQKKAGHKEMDLSAARIGAFVPYFEEIKANLIGMLQDSNVSDAERLREIDRILQDAEAIRSGEKTVKYEEERVTGNGVRFTGEATISKKEADDFIKSVQTLKEELDKATDAKNALEKFKLKEFEEANKKIEAARNSLTKAESGLVKENGKYRLATDEDASKARLARLQEINKELKDQTTDEAKRLSLRAEYASLVKSELQYQTRLKQEREREAEAAKKAMEAEKKLAAQQAEAERKKVETAKEQLKTAQASYVLNKYGNVIRKKNADELANDRRNEIADLKEQIKSLSATAARRDATPEELAQWGGRYNPATRKMDGAQKQSGWRGLLSDGKGGFMTEVSRGLTINGKEVEIPLIVPDSTEEELVKIAKIAHGEFVNERDIMAIEEKAVSFAKKRLAEGKSPFFNGDAADEALRNINANAEDFAKLIEEQTRLLQLQSEQSQYAESLKTAAKANEDARKGYVFDDSGAVLRRKTEKELLAEQEEEIAAARKRVAETQSGTQERLDAEAELTRLEIEAFNMRKKNNTADMLNEARANNSRLVQGIEARSSAALALEARSFRRDDSETAILKDTKEVQTDIKEAVTKLLTGFTDFTSTFSDVKNLLQPL